LPLIQAILNLRLVMESITFFGRLLLTPTLPLQVVAVEAVEEMVRQELQDHRVLLALMGL
jgi:hypothetical protein